MSKTIKARDAKFGDYCQDDYKSRRVRVAHEFLPRGDKVVVVDEFGNADKLPPDYLLTELPAECDSFDWQPAANDNPNGVRWFVYGDKGVRCYPASIVFTAQSKAWSFTQVTLNECEDSPYNHEITTTEALALINANDWPEGVAKAKELAGIVEDVEHPITKGSVWKDDVGSEWTIVAETVFIARHKNGLGAYGYHENIEDVFDGQRKKFTWLRDAEPAAPQSSETGEEVRWYLDERAGIIRGYAKGKAVSINGSEVRAKGDDVACEQACAIDNDTRLSTPQVLCRLAHAGHVDAWNATRKLAGLSEHEAYLAGQSVCGIDAGDRVQIIRKSSDREMGWSTFWVSDLQATKKLAVSIIDSKHGVCLSNNAWYPYFVLERIETPAEATPVESPAEVATEIDPGPEPQPAADHGFAVGDWVRLPGHPDAVPVVSVDDGCLKVKINGHDRPRLVMNFDMLTKVTFRPFANAAEFEPFRDEWIRHKNNGSRFRISGYDDNYASGLSYRVMFEYCEFCSGRPCGVEVVQ